MRIPERAIEALKREDGQLAQGVRPRFHAGLSVEETAEAMEPSAGKVKHDRNLARAGRTLA